MSSNVGRRLEKLEQFQGNRTKRLFVVRGHTEEQRDAYVADLIRSGEAPTTDTFVIRPSLGRNALIPTMALFPTS